MVFYLAKALSSGDDIIEISCKDAEKNKAEDEKKAELIKAKNSADAMVTASEKAIKDAGDKAPKEVIEKVNEKIKAVKDILETGTKEELEAKTKELSDTLSEVGQAMYGAQSTTEEPKEEKKSDKKDDSKVEEGEVVQ